jgi:hypothetical protein
LPIEIGLPVVVVHRGSGWCSGSFSRSSGGFVRGMVRGEMALVIEDVRSGFFVGGGGVGFFFVRGGEVYSSRGFVCYIVEVRGGCLVGVGEVRGGGFVRGSRLGVCGGGAVRSGRFDGSSGDSDTFNSFGGGICRGFMAGNVGGFMAGNVGGSISLLFVVGRLVDFHGELSVFSTSVLLLVLAVFVG